MPYWQRKHESGSAEFENAVKAMFDRVHALVSMLKKIPKPSGFRVLDCLGIFHDIHQQRFGLVYAFPFHQSEPLRLNGLLRRHKTYEIHPDPSQKLALARALVGSVQSFHVSGWIHKQISSFNVLFFPKTGSALEDLDFSKPYVVGFDHNRKDGQGEYSQGPISTNISREYLYPDYRNGTRPSRISDDYYSLGLVLLEIGTWVSISNIYRKYPTHSPTKLKEEYAKFCDEHLRKAMGSIFYRATKCCLQWDEGVEKRDVGMALDFQSEVVDKLNMCVF